MMHKRADLLRWSQTRLNIWTNTLQARNQFSRFGGVQYIFRGNNFCFYYMFKTNFSGHNKIWAGTKEI